MDLFTQNTDNQALTEIKSTNTSDINTDNQALTHYIYNSYDGIIKSFDTIIEAIEYLTSEDLKKWYDNREFIPAKSNFEICEIVNNGNGGNDDKTILKIKARKLFNL
tara:strand:+ start:192 stop:512 length:321 start_codon:yes stop_codon:yes gene_type:complete